MAHHFWNTLVHATLASWSLNGPSVITHLRDALADEERCAQLQSVVDTPYGPIIMDYSRQKVDAKVMSSLFELANVMRVRQRIDAMFNGDKINRTEKRAVLHTALRAAETDKFIVDGKDVVPEVHGVLKRIAAFADEVRSGKRLGHTGKPLTDVVSIGIGGSYLGPEFVYEAMRTYAPAAKSASGRRLRFLANVDPIDVDRALEGLNPETTLVVVISKTFTTAETMLNAKTVKEWLLKGLGGDSKAIAKHMCAVSTNIPAVEEFGIAKENVFGFWDWVGGRFSVCSAVGALPLALQYGFPHFQDFLSGCRWMDHHFRTAPMEKNLPIILALLGIWNATYLDYNSVAVLPYCQALLRFAAHIQQLTMESNGKRVTLDGERVQGDCGEIFFGEPGTNGQHSFYQLIHQGRVIPADFIGFAKSQSSTNCQDSPVMNHDELMSNFFAQPDALAIGKTEEQLQKEGCPPELIQHKIFDGDRPSTSILMPECTPFFMGALLALYEHRTAAQGFVWGINSFDQWGVELGKVLAKNVRHVLVEKRSGKSPDVSSLPYSTRKMIDQYISMK